MLDWRWHCAEPGRVQLHLHSIGWLSLDGAVSGSQMSVLLCLCTAMFRCITCTVLKGNSKLLGRGGLYGLPVTEKLCADGCMHLNIHLQL